MAHTREKDLADIAALLGELAALPGVAQKKPGIFYRKGQGFLHFHDKEGVRWADLKVGGAWQRIELDFGASPAAQKRLVKAARQALESADARK